MKRSFAPPMFNLPPPHLHIRVCNIHGRRSDPKHSWELVKLAGKSYRRISLRLFICVFAEWEKEMQTRMRDWLLQICLSCPPFYQDIKTLFSFYRSISSLVFYINTCIGFNSYRLYKPQYKTIQTFLLFHSERNVTFESIRLLITQTNVRTVEIYKCVGTLLTYQNSIHEKINVYLNQKMLVIVQSKHFCLLDIYIYIYI